MVAPAPRPLSTRTLRLGKTGFLEVARRELDGRSFVVITRGFYALDGARRAVRFVTLPDEPDVRAWLAAELAREA
jgi:hypothetical protein